MCQGPAISVIITPSGEVVCVQISCHITEMSCIKGALLGSLGSSLDSAAHLANFFMSVSPDVPMDEMASALFKALKMKVDSMRPTLSQSSLHQDHKIPGTALLKEAIPYERKSDHKEGLLTFFFT